MNRTFMLPLAAVVTVALLVSGCQPSRVWANKKKNKEDREYRDNEVYRQPPPPPRQTARYYSSAALIITPTPGFVMKQSSNGRFYHHSHNGFLYWKGYDNRFYIDQSHLSNLRYSRWEYDEWKRYNRQSR